MDKERTYALFDVREPGEYNAGHISGATLLPRRDIEFRIADLAPVRDTPIFVAGDSDERAKLAATTIQRIGYKNVYVLEGGFPAWTKAGCPTATGINGASKEFGERVHIECAVPEIEPQELHRRATLGERIAILDARTPEEYSRFCIPGGLHIPGGDLILSAGDLTRDRNATVVVNCAGRTRSIIGTETLRHLGLSNVYALKNGTMGWLLAGLELEQQPNRGQCDAILTGKSNLAGNTKPDREVRQRPPPIRSRVTRFISAMKFVACTHTISLMESSLTKTEAFSIILP